MLKNIKGAIFDMDGTLVDSLMLWDILWKKFGNHFCENGNFAPSNADDKAVRTMTLKDAMEYIHTQYNIGKSGDELLETANKIMIETFNNKTDDDLILTNIRLNKLVLLVNIAYMQKKSKFLVKNDYFLWPSGLVIPKIHFDYHHNGLFGKRIAKNRC